MTMFDYIEAYPLVAIVVFVLMLAIAAENIKRS